MGADFDKAYQDILVWEGDGWENNPADPGGETFCGISKRFDTTFPGWVLIDNLKALQNFPQNLKANQTLMSQVKQWYFDNYWVPVGGNLIADQDIADKLFSIGVNLGPNQTVTFLQKTINILNYHDGTSHVFFDDLKMDGVMGTQTLLALQILLANHDAAHILHYITGFQEYHYAQNCLVNPGQREFARGWDNRGKYANGY